MYSDKFEKRTLTITNIEGSDKYWSDLSRLACHHIVRSDLQDRAIARSILRTEVDIRDKAKNCYNRSD